MDTLLCDELLQEIFRRLPPPSSAAVSLVSKRWRLLLHSSTTALSLNLPPPYNSTTVNSLSNFLTKHPFLSSLSIAGVGDSGEDHLLLSVASSCPNLRHLRFLSSPVSPFYLLTLSTSCVNLSSINISISRPMSFNWLPYFKSLRTLALSFTNSSTEISNFEVNEMNDTEIDVNLSLESLSLSGIWPGDYAISFLWKNCKNIKKLQLKSCVTLGDYPSFFNFLQLSNNLQVLELRTCRSIVDLVLLQFAEDCVSLESLLIYDGGSREGLRQFFNRTKCNFKKIDLRLPLDLDNSHLIAMSENVNFRGLKSLMLQSCCVVTGEGLKALARAIGNELEELALINCDVVDSEPGLLTTLGQSLRRLRKLNLSYNDFLVDKELKSMLVSCNLLCEVKLRGCNRLSDAALVSMVRSCKELRSVDVMYCRGIKLSGVEFLVMNGSRLEHVEVEESKVSEEAKRWAVNKRIEVAS